MTDKRYLEELAQFIRKHRNNESHFQILYDRLNQEYQAVQANNTLDNAYAEGIREVQEKYAATYKENKEKGIGTWSEFENMVSHFEKTVTNALNHP